MLDLISQEKKEDEFIRLTFSCTQYQFMQGLSQLLSILLKNNQQESSTYFLLINRCHPIHQIG